MNSREWLTVEGVSPVTVMRTTAVEFFPSSTGPEKSRVNLPGPPGKPKYSLLTDSESVP